MVHLGFYPAEVKSFAWLPTLHTNVHNLQSCCCEWLALADIDWCIVMKSKCTIRITLKIWHFKNFVYVHTCTKTVTGVGVTVCSSTN